MNKVIKNPNYEQQVQNMLEEGFGEIIQNILIEARLRCPVDTGLLRSQIKTLKFENLEADVGTEGSEYAKFVELGTIKQSSQPFLREALDDVISRL